MFRLKRCLEAFCIDCYKHDDLESHSFRIIKPSREDSLEYISERYDSLDYELCENKLFVEQQKRYGLPFISYLEMQKYFVILIIGILTGCAGAFVEVAVECLSCYKFKFIAENTSPNFKNGIVLYLLYVSFTVIPAAIGSALVIIIEPKAKGGGISGVMGFLNGIRVPRVIKLKTLLVKQFSVIFAVVSGMAVGKEGPMIHIGAAIGGTVPMMHVPFTKMYLFRHFHSDKSRRDFAAAGYAAGLTAAFGTPLGGMLMVLEEGISFWSAHLTFRIFVCTLATVCTLNFLMSCYKGYEGQLARDELLFLSVVNQTSKTTYELVELPIFVLMGAMGAIFGAIWIKLQKILIIFRKKYITGSKLKFLQVLVVAALNATSCFFILTNIYSCSPLSGVNEVDCEPPPWEIKGRCKEGYFHTTAIFCYQNSQLILSSLYSSHIDFIGYIPLLIFIVHNYLLSCLASGTDVSTGLFIPNLVTGAAWGRLLAIFLQYINPETKYWAQATKYAFMGSAAHLSGVTQLTFSIGVMMTEASGGTGFFIPIFLMLITTKLVGKILTESIFHTEATLDGLPLLSKRPPPLCLEVSAKDVMNRGPLESLPIVTTVGTIVRIALNSNHNGFPIVDNSSISSQDGINSFGRVEGLILKSQLNSIIEKRTFDTPRTSIVMRDTMRLFQNQFASSQEITEADTIGLPERKVVDLSPYMNPNPYIVRMNTSLSQTHKLFAELGLRHLIVVNSVNEAVGIITRKDLAVYKQTGNYCAMCIKKLNTRP